MPADERLPYGRGVFRRRFLLERDAPGRVVADMEDDFHRFRLVLEHDGRAVVAIRGEAARYPWTQCPGATRPLEALVGMALSVRSTAVADHTNARANCTHLFDLAGLAVAHAAADRGRRLYDIEVPDRVGGVGGKTRARLHRDGELLLDWELEGERIAQPQPFAGVVMRGSKFLRWAESELDPDTAEAAIALRRACYIAVGRSQNLDRFQDATPFMALIRGICHTFTPGIAEQALRVRGTSLEFTDHPERLLADLEPGAGAGKS